MLILVCFAILWLLFFNLLESMSLSTHPTGCLQFAFRQDNMATKMAPHGASIKLRNKSGVHKFKISVVGQPLSSLTTLKLPNKKNILARYLGFRHEFELIKKKESVKSISNLIVKELLIIWENASLPCIRYDKVLEKTTYLISEFENVLKSWKRYEDSPDKLETYRKSLLALHDIAPLDIEAKLRSNCRLNTEWKEDFEFYKCQSAVPQVGSLGARDKVLAKRIKEKEEKEEAQLKRKIKNELSKAAKTVHDDEEEQHEDKEAEDKDYIPSKKVMKIAKQKMSTSVIDDTSPIAVCHGVSSRAHLAIVAGTVQSMGGDITEIKASVATVNRKRKSVCKALAEKMCVEFNTRWKGWPKIIQ